MLKSLIAEIKSLLPFFSTSHLAQNRPVRLLIAGHDLKFMPPYITFFENDPRFELRIDEHDGHGIKSEAFSRECVEWADMIFCEWALGNLVWYSRHKRPGQLLIARLHLQEWQDRDRISYLYDTKWENVDRLLLTSHHVYDHMIEEFPVLRGSRARVLYCPIDASGVFSREKQNDAMHHLGIVGIVPQRKRIDLALDILEQVQKKHPDVKLFIKSRRPEEYSWMVKYRPEEMAWYESTLKRIDQLPNPASVVWDAHGDDMPAWFSKIGFLISTSDFEGSHQAVAESMAAGCVPIIRDWEGANRIYPPKYVWSHPEEAAAIVLSHLQDDSFTTASKSVRQYAQDNFDAPLLCKTVAHLATQHFGCHRPGIFDEESMLEVNRFHPAVMILGYINPGYQSGYRIRIEEEIRNLLRWGVRVHFACLHEKASHAVLRQHRKELEALGATVHLICSDAFFQVGLTGHAISDALDALSKICTENRINRVHAEALYSMRVALLLKERLPELKLSFDIHGATPEEEIMGGATQERIDAMEKWEKRALEQADLNVIVSKAMGTYLRAKYNYTKDNFFVLPCCVAESRFPEEAAKPLFSLPENRTIVAYAGTLTTWQCGEEMIRLFAALHACDSNLHFLLLVPEQDHAKARELMAQQGLKEEAATLKALPYEEVPAALAQAHAGVLLRRNDPVNRVASPTKFAEYLAAGLPVLMTDGIGDYSTFSQEHKVGCVLEEAIFEQNPLDKATLETILSFLHNCCETRSDIRRQCRLLARTHFHWDQNAQQLARIYGDQN